MHSGHLTTTNLKLSPKVGEVQMLTPLPFCQRAFIASLLLTGTLHSQSRIETLVGQYWNFPRDVSQASNAPISRIEQFAADQAGNIFIADAGNDQILQVAPGGTLTIFAGNGVRAYSGDGGQALRAAFSSPSGIAVDRNGNVYVADSLNHRVRRIAHDGIIATIAGTGIAGYSGDGGPADQAALNSPARLALDAAGANLFILDYQNNVVRRVDAQGRIATVAGHKNSVANPENGIATNATLSNPGQIIVDSAGNLYIADTNNNRILKVTGATAANLATTPARVTTILSNQNINASIAAPSPALDGPSGLALASDGTLYFSDRFNNMIRALTPANTVALVAGTGEYGGDDGAARSATFRHPFGLAIDSQQNLFIADFGSESIRKLTLGNVSRFAGNARFRAVDEPVSARSAYLSVPDYAALDSDGNLYITDTGNARVVKVSPSNSIVTVAGPKKDLSFADKKCATEPFSFLIDFPSGIAVDSTRTPYFADYGINRIYKLLPDGQRCTVAGSGQKLVTGSTNAADAQLSTIFGIAFDSRNNLYIAQPDDNRVLRLTFGATPTIAPFAGSGKAGYSGDGGQAANATLNGPHGLAFDAAGNLYIADRYNHVIRKVTADGIISTVAGNGQGGFAGDGGAATLARLFQPQGVAVDGTGNIFIADTENNRVRGVSRTGIITTVAGTGDAGFFGDGGLPTSATLNYPTAVAVRPDGTVLIVDQKNDRIRTITGSPAPVVLSVTPQSIMMQADAGGPPPPGQIVNLASSEPGIPFTVSTNADAAGSVIITPDHGITPAALKITADPLALKTGNATVAVTIRAANATPVVVNVNVAVAAPQPAVLRVAPATLSFRQIQGSDIVPAQINVVNDGGGSVTFTVTAATDTGGDWLHVQQTQPATSATSPALLNIGISAANLQPDTYSANIAVHGGDGTELTVPVVLTISPPLPALLLSQTGVTIRTVARGGAPPPQIFEVAAAAGRLHWTATARQVSGNTSWLRVSPSGGDAGATPTTISVSANANGLDAGDYYGELQITPDQNSDATRTVTVVLKVLPPGTDPGVEALPTSLLFSSPNTSSPGSQDVVLYNLSPSPQTFTAQQDQPWIIVKPDHGSIDSSTPVPVTIQPNFNLLKPGLNTATITFAFTDTASGAVTLRPVNILAYVPGTAGVLARGLAFAATCSTPGLAPQLLQPREGIVVVAGQPVTIETRILDNCGNPVAADAVTARFSTKDPPLTLARSSSGTWMNSWVPRDVPAAADPSQTSSPVGLAITAYSGGTANPSGGRLTVYLQTDPMLPVIRQSGVANAANPLTQTLAPCSLMTIQGARLADPAPGNATTVLLGVRTVPLVDVSPERITAQVPCEAPMGSLQSLRVQRGPALSVPESVPVADAQPEIYAKDGSTQGAIFHFAAGAPPSILADENAPAASGDSIILFATGLGLVSPAVPTGVMPGDTPSTSIAPVGLTIGGRPAQNTPAVLVPGMLGVYSVNAIVPPGVAPGNAVPVILIVQAAEDKPSRPVTMAVQ
jgi:uncharacterized protein (TIGR03437 family)